MKARLSVVKLTLLGFILSGCAPPKDYEVISQPKHVALTVYIDGEIVSIEKNSDLPNAFGGADIFGGKVDGFIFYRPYLRRSNHSKATGRRYSVRCDHNEPLWSRCVLQHKTFVGNSVNRWRNYDIFWNRNWYNNLL